MHVLVLTDFSTAADHALHYADALAVQLRATLVLLHVQRTSFFDPEALTGALSPLSEGEVAAALLQRRNGLAAPVVTEATAARVPEAARAAARRYQPAVLVLGRSTAAGKSPEVVAHTTALELLGQLPCPLLLVPEQAPLAVPPRHITIAADGQSFSLPLQSTPIVAWLHQLPAHFAVVHVTDSQRDEGAAPAYQQVAASGLLPVDVSIPQQHTVAHHSIADGIVQGAQETHADLLVLPARRHGLLHELFHHSVTARIVHRAPLPVLLLPGEK